MKCTKMFSFLLYIWTFGSALALNCAPEWTAYNQQCYIQVIGPNVTQPEAAAECVRLGGHLTEINTKQENQWLARFAATSEKLHLADQPWIALRKVGRVWGYDSNRTEFGHKWASGEPNNIRNHESCVKFVTDPGAQGKYNGAYGVLNDTPCDRPSTRFICRGKEVPAFVPDPLPVDPILVDPIPSAPIINVINSNVNCPTGWTGLDATRSCYKHVTNLNVTQDEAEAQCVLMQAHLTSISSREETVFLNKRWGLADQPWIGTKKIGPKLWKTTDRTEASYLPWAPSEPNNVRNHENCIKFVARPGAISKYGGKEGILNDTPCDRPSPRFICKKPQSL